jgi:alpha-2-macroglobulin
MKIWFTLAFGGWMIGMTALGQDAAALRKERDALVQKGLWREGLEFYEERLLPIQDDGATSDLEKAVNCLSQLGEWRSFDGLLDRALEGHPGDASLRIEAAAVLSNAPHSGRVLAGEFERQQGYHGRGRFRGGADGAPGEMVNTTHRDRVQSLRWLVEALGSAKDDTTRSRAWDLMAALMRDASEFWKLQVLTPLDRTPEWSDPGPSGGTEGAPWSGDGPVLFPIPARWDLAKNDGERWRFALAESARLMPAHASRSELERARLLEMQFGAETLESYGWFNGDDPESEKGQLALDTLADDECLARTSDGVRRFKLPADQHFIAIYRSLLADKGVGGEAGDELVQVYISRHQLDRAETALREAISKHGDGGEGKPREKLLAQITGAWGRFEPAKTVAAGTHPVLPLAFRNTTSVKLTAAPINMERVLRDTKTYLESNPKELDWERLQPGQIGSRLIEGKPGEYVGEVASAWESALKPLEKHRETHADIEMPLDKAGAWWVTAKLANGNTIHTIAWVVDSVLVQHALPEALQWMLADAASGAPVAEGELEFFGYRTVALQQKDSEGQRFEIQTKTFVRKTDGEGKVLLKAGDADLQMQWMVVARKDGRTPAFHDFGSFGYQPDSAEERNRNVPYAVTDRPLYKAGDKLHAKFWLREVGYGQINESRWEGKDCRVIFTDGRGQEAIKLENLKTDAMGAVEIETVLPKNSVLGSWTGRLEVPNQMTAMVKFRVEEYRKPEYEVSVEAPKEPVRLGDKFPVTVKATYFHGAPVRNATVAITVKRESMTESWFPGWRWDWLYGKGAWWCGIEASWHPGWSNWGCLPPHPPWWQGDRFTPEELVIERTLPIGADGTAMVEVDTAMAKLVHGDMDAKYVIEAKVVDASRREERGNGSVVAARKPFEIVVQTNQGYARPGDEVEAKVSAATLEGKPVKAAEGTLRLLRLVVGENGKIDEKEVSIWPVKTDAEGEITQRFQAPVAGQYRLAAKLSIAGGEAVEGAIILNVHGTEKPGVDWHFGAIELVPDKLSYGPKDTVRLRVNSDQTNAHVWLFLRSEQGGGREVKRIVLDGRSGEVEIPLSIDDMPNTFIEALTVHGAEVHSTVRQILLPPESRVLEVTVEPAKAKVKPQEKSSLLITIRDSEGKPFSGSATLAIYDKSLEAITGGSNVGSIHESFWSWKRNYWGPRNLDSVPESPGNLIKQDDEEMEDLGSVLMELSHEGAGFGGGGPRGQILQKSMSRMRGMAVTGAAPVPMAAMAEMDAAGGAPGGGEPEGPAILVRKDFADLLKWSGEVKTDANGRAEIPLEFPDNLTTWKARVWALGEGTRVGEGSAEIITSKQLLVRLEAPRFLVEKDEAVFSAVVHNDYEVAKTVKVSLELDGGVTEVMSGETKSVEIAAKGESRIDWRVKATREGELTIRMKAAADEDGDAMERKLPVVVHGMLRQEAWSRVVEPEQDSAKIGFKVPAERRVDETRLTVRVSPSVAGAVVDAIPYLADYPHGCTEQTLNRFVPAVIAQKLVKDLGVNLDEIRAKRNNLNPQELGDPKERAERWKQWQGNPVFDSEVLSQMVKTGFDKLEAMQNSDGGWGWFSGYGEQSYPHTTAVVVHGLLTAKASGAEVPEQMLKKGLNWLESSEKKEAAALRRYADRIAAEKAGKKVKPTNLYQKANADSLDAFVRMVLGEAGRNGDAMVDFLVRDNLSLPIYARCLLGLELHRTKENGRRDEVMATISQFLKRDEENQTNYLDLKNGGYWWFWYGGDVEAHAWYLKLLSAAKPQAKETRGLVKYLVNNRKHASHWNSTRDTAYAIEAIAAYLKASGELSPEMEVEVLLDGKSLRKISVNRDNLFAFDGTITVDSAGLATGAHEIELKRSGKGALYANAYLEIFSLEEFLPKAGLEVKVERHVYKLVPEDKSTAVPDSTGLVVTQKVERFRREPLKDGDSVASGDRIEVELVLESKNDYEYLLFSDHKPAGFEALDALSGYTSGTIGAYMEPRDRTVDFFVRSLARGKSQVSYQLRAEAPGLYHALPTTAEAMYAPELRGNSDEIRLNITEAK